MDEDNVFSDDGGNGGKRVQRTYQQQYRKAWEKLPDFKGWLTSVPGKPTRAYCRACKKDLHAHRLTLLKHTISVKHMKASQQLYEETLLETRPNTVQPLYAKIELEVDENNSSEEEDAPSANDSFESGKFLDYEDEVEVSNLSPTVYANVRKKMSEANNSTKPAPNQRQSSSDPEALDNESEMSSTAPEANSSSVSTVEIQPEPPRSLVIARPNKPPISTHVLDTTKGLPVSGLRISLYQLIDGRWTHLNESSTNPDGRCIDLIGRGSVIPGRYKMHFETHQYFELRGQDCLFPFVEVVFDVRSPAEHLHIPLLMTPYNYTVYRGS